MRHRTSPYAYTYTYAHSDAHAHAHAHPSAGTYDSSSAPRRILRPSSPTASASPTQRYNHVRMPSSWPPSPSVEDDTGDKNGDDDGEPPAHTRGTIDQEALLDNMAPLTRERTSTPYAYTRPERASTASQSASMSSTRESTTERQPTPYSFVKSDLHTEHRDIRQPDTTAKPAPTRRDSGQPARPASHLPTELHPSYSSPTSCPAIIRPMPLPRFLDKPRLSSRHDSTEKNCPSYTHDVPAAFSLPYPVEGRPDDVCMPPEEQYQFDHSIAKSPRHRFSPTQELSLPSLANSSRLSDSTPSSAPRSTDMFPKSFYVGSINSDPPQASPISDVWSNKGSWQTAPLDLGKPLPSCPRGTPSRNHDWYELKGYDSFDVCPSCYQSAFATTPFAGDFCQTRLYMQPVERICDFSSPWVRLAWLLIIQRRLRSLELLYSLAEIAETERPCPGDHKVGTDRVDWYGMSDHRSGLPVTNFSICSCCKKKLEALFPTMRKTLTRLSSSQPYSQDRYFCSLRTSSRRSRKYLDLIVALDAEAQSLDRQLNISSFLQLVRDNAYKGECNQDKTFVHKPWHFIPSLPEFTVCEECYEECVWPAMRSRLSQPTLPSLFNKTIQIVPGENPELGSSCCLYSAHMRRVWNTSVRQDNFTFLAQKVLERKRAETRLLRERKDIVHSMLGVERGTSQWERAKLELRNLDQEWASW